MTVRDLPFDAAATPLAGAAAWMLERYLDGELTVAQASDPAHVYPVDNVELRRRAFDGFRRPIVEVRGYEEVDNFAARINVTDDKGRPMIVLVLQHPDHRGQVWQAAMILDPPGVMVRSAWPGDAEALRALESATPVQHDGFHVAYDRPDPFAQDRLRPRPTLRCVAEIDGHVVGSLADALHVLVIGDDEVPVSYVHHARVHPDHQGEGVMPALNGFNWAPVMQDGVARAGFMYTSLGNDRIRSWSSQGNRRATTRPVGRLPRRVTRSTAPTSPREKPRKKMHGRAARATGRTSPICWRRHTDTRCCGPRRSRAGSGNA